MADTNAERLARAAEARKLYANPSVDWPLVARKVPALADDVEILVAENKELREELDYIRRTLEGVGHELEL